LGPDIIGRYCPLDKGGEELIADAFERLALSARGYHKILRVARTIADLAQSETIEKAHLAEALQYRQKPGGIMR